MFFGADQFKNHVGNNVIIKCHKCGDTNLRYVDTTRSSVAGSGYICGNGHETGGSLDDYGVFGQADTLGSNVMIVVAKEINVIFQSKFTFGFKVLKEYKQKKHVLQELLMN